MVSKGYATCVRIVSALKEVARKDKVSLQQLETVIKQIAGTDPRTIQNYKQTLVEFKLLQITSEGFKITATAKKETEPQEEEQSE